MEARAYLRNARISPRRVQIVLDLIRNTGSDHEADHAESTGQSLSHFEENFTYHDCSERRRVKSSRRLSYGPEG